MKQDDLRIVIEKVMEKAEENIDDHKTEIRLDENKDDAVETLKQIENDWFAEQRTRFENTTLASRKRNSNFHGFKLLKDSLFKKRRVKDILRLYLPKILKFLIKQMRKFLIWLVEYILKVEKR
jgi:hypothetical protein